jgi:glutamine amidotransferase
MIAIVDYGVGNLFSIQSSLKKIGFESKISNNKNDILTADSIILPGVGAFGDAINKLKECQLDDVIKQAVKENKPLLGICLGMQLLFNKSYEYGEYKGLGLIEGEVCSLEKVTKNLKIPHIGWNSLNFKNKDSKLLKYIKEGDYAYFVHSYYANCPQKYITATAEYGIDVTAIVENNNVYGTQFHPEKSGEVGLKILKAFCEIKN